jgi:uncharacterized membrane protein
VTSTDPSLAPSTADPRRAQVPAFVTGVGLGMFADGIVLHQLLQWHHLVVERLPADDVGGLRDNVVWDGIFHTGAWVVVVAGLLWLSHRGEAARALGVRRVGGLLLAGWGAFTLLDQVLFHLVLRAHTVRTDGDPLLYEGGYTLLGIGLVGVGLALSRRR